MMLHYRVLGKGDPLVILHGLFGSSDNWQSQAKIFAEYYTVYLVDLRNHGHSFWSPAHSYALMAEDLRMLTEELNLKNIILLGHSMGAKVAMTFAQQHPGLLDKLILVDMGIKEYPMHHQHILAGIKKPTPAVVLGMEVSCHMMQIKAKKGTAGKIEGDT
jgi:pimeloyl-ACP methyl ester carboxylesterase